METMELNNPKSDSSTEIVEAEVDYNADFDTSVFGVLFDAFLCRSIWTHASKCQIETMLDNFLRDGTSRAFFLTSYLPANLPGEDYKGTQYRGRSHKCNVPAEVKHRRSWIRDATIRGGYP